MRRGAIGAMLLAVLALPSASAQRAPQLLRPDWVGSTSDSYTRLLQLTGVAPLGSRMLRPAEDSLNFIAPDSATWRSPWAARYAMAGRSPGSQLRIVAPEYRSTYNAAVPYGMNDGAMWAGKGLSFEITTGVRADFGVVSAQFAPTITHSDNEIFDLGAQYKAPQYASRFADVWLSEKIDMPQRFGDRPVQRIDAGQSFVRAAWRGFAAGVSSESMWWGPGVENSLLMSNNAAGFPHAFLGTTRAHNIGIGKVEALWTVGTLQQSAFWRTAGDTFPTNRWLNSLSVVFEPKGAPGMYFGATRTFYAYQKYNPVNAGELLKVFQTFEKKGLASDTNPNGNDRRDQMLSLFARFVFPESGFEVYGEFGKGDHDWDFRTSLLEPDHSRAYVLGARKVFRVADGILAVHGEITSLAQTKTSLVRPTPYWYAHHIVQQGYTERGQVIGAGIGPGSDAQNLSVDWMAKRGGAGLVIQRMRVNDDVFFKVYNNVLFSYQKNHDVFVGMGPRVTWFAGPLELEVLALAQREYNRYTILGNDVINGHVELRVTWVNGLRAP